MANEIYFNREELNLFKKCVRQNASTVDSDDGVSVSGGDVDFFLPNSLENCSTNFLQKIRLTRQFQRTLASVKGDSASVSALSSASVTRDSGNCSVAESAGDEIEDFLFNESNDPDRREILEHFFAEWRTLIDLRLEIPKEKM